MVESLSLNFRVFTVKLVGVRKFRNFKVHCKINCEDGVVFNNFCNALHSLNM